MTMRTLATLCLGLCLAEALQPTSSSTTGSRPAAGDLNLKPPSILDVCKRGCPVVTAPCNASDPLQGWGYFGAEYGPQKENSILLYEGAGGVDGHYRSEALCLNVARMGTSKGAEIWVTDCHTEHPDKANRQWVIANASSGGRATNPRSQHCLAVSQQGDSMMRQRRRSQQQEQHTVLGDCLNAPKWVVEACDPAHDYRSLIKNVADGTCLKVDTHGGAGPSPSPAGEPSPPFPNALPPPSTVVTTVKLGGHIATSGGPSYASFNFDWHCGASDSHEYHCPAEPGWNHSSVNFGLDLTNPPMIAAAKALAPGRLRLGGSQGDWICYDIPAGSCAEEIKRHPVNGHGGYKANSEAFVLNMTRWQQIVDFCEATGLQLVFGLNGDTRAGYHSPLNWTQNNTQNFVEYVSKNNAKHIFGFEVGNEKCGKIDPEVYINDMRYLRKLVDKNWQAGETKPLVIAPDCNPIGGSWVNEFLANASGVMDVFTYHNYVGYGLDPQLAPKIMDPSGKFFDSGPGRAAAMISGWKKFGAPHGMQIWVGEIAAAWHSGEPGVTNRFISSFWYADALGLLASLNHTGFCRQTLIGGNYGLLNRTTGAPNPDFFMAQMFHDLMGEKVLSLTSDMKKQGLRTYAHCHAQLAGNASLLFINVDPTKSFSVALPGDLAQRGLETWTFAAGDGSKERWNGLDSRIIKLNQKPLVATAAALLPKLVGRRTTAPTLLIPPLTITFVAVKGVTQCHARQY